MKIHHLEKIRVSIIIINYNNAKLLSRCCNSAINQTYLNKEIMVVDDYSTDNSLDVLKKYKKKIKIIKINSKKKKGGLNQINACIKGVEKSSGEIIFFLDSDDFFHKKKVLEIVNYFNRNKRSNLVFDLQIIYFSQKKKVKKKFKQKKFIISPWPRFSPQSCICVKKSYLKNAIKYINVKKFLNIWFDFRLAIYSFLESNKINIYNKHLTFYQQKPGQATDKWKFGSKNWWIRRNEAHDYFNYISKLLSKKKGVNIDYIITKLIGSINKN